MGFIYANMPRDARYYSHTDIKPVLDGRKKPLYTLRYYNTDLVTWMPDGKVRVAWEWRGPATKQRINYALPKGEIVVIDGTWILRIGQDRYLAQSGMTISANGRVHGAKRWDKWWGERKPAILARRRDQARLRYWQDAAAQERRVATDPGAHVIKRRPLTVASIMAEPNTTIRMAKARIYGIVKFLHDAGATVVNSEAGYDLLRFELGTDAANTPEWQRGRNNVQALKMTCPSTGQTYIETVPPTVNTVREALDWRFDTTNYLDRIGQAT